MILVFGEDCMCFWADALTLEPRSHCFYDPWCFTKPITGDRMHVNEWNSRYTKQ